MNLVNLINLMKIEVQDFFLTSRLKIYHYEFLLFTTLRITEI